MWSGTHSETKIDQLDYQLSNLHKNSRPHKERITWFLLQAAAAAPGKEKNTHTSFLPPSPSLSGPQAKRTSFMCPAGPDRGRSEVADWTGVRGREAAEGGQLRRSIGF